MASSRIDTVVAKLREQIAREPHEVYLPSIAGIARSMRVDVHVVSKAMKCLRDAGEVTYRRGQKVRIIGREHSVKLPPMDRRTSAELLFEDLRRSIIVGDYLTGKDLPAVSNMAQMRRVAPATVRVVYNRLCEEDLARKRGRQWIVGPSSVAMISSTPPVIVLVQPHGSLWSSMVRDPRNGPFTGSFEAESSRCGVSLMGCNTQLHPGGMEILPTGDREIIALVKDLDYRYRGAIVVGRAEDHREFPTLIEGLLRFGQAVAWYDYSGQESDRSLGIGSKKFIQFRLSDNRVATTAGEFLASQGHQQIGFAGYRSVAWQAKRCDIIQTTLKQRHQASVVVSYDDVEAALQMMSITELADLLRSRHQGQSKRDRKLVDRVLQLGGSEVPRGGLKTEVYEKIARMIKKDTAFLSPDKHDETVGMLPLLMLLVPATTVIVSPRDSISRQHLSFIRRTDLDIPGDISLLSFDNYLNFTTFPVTTIDAGGAALGYAAFHTLMGDIPVPVGPDRTMHATPRVVRRDTVASVHRH